MRTALDLDEAAITHACRLYGVARLSVFGSVLTPEFDPVRSDVDLLVEFEHGRENLFHDYFDLKDALEEIVGRPVDLVDAAAVANPYFKAAVLASAQEFYAA